MVGPPVRTSQPASQLDEPGSGGAPVAASHAASHAAPKLRKLKVSGLHQELSNIPPSVANTRHAGKMRASERGGGEGWGSE